MTSEEGVLRKQPVPAIGPADDDDNPNALSTRDWIRLLMPPAIATVLFIGGVYWVRLQAHAGAAGQDAPIVVQVHLLPRPDPVPVPLAPATQSAPASPVSRSQITADVAAETLDKTHSDQIDRAPSVGPVANTDVGPTAVSTALQNAAIAQFRDTLLRHIASYQRYPKAAQRDRLQGTVDTVFSLGRDGRLLGVWIKTSSGAAALDQAAIDTIHRAQPLPVVPAALPDPLRIEIKLGFDPS
jgi:protein TonB